jgi:O-antigen/teichoic acid export membrane protein
MMKPAVHPLVNSEPVRMPADPVAEPASVEVNRVLARNAAWNYIGFAINVGTNLLLFPFVVSHVGESAAGIWLLLGSLTGYMGLLELGLVPSLTQHVAAALGAGRREEVDRAVSTVLVVLTGMMVLSLQALWLIPALTAMLHLPESLQDEARLVFAVSLAGVALRMPLAAFQAVLLGCQRQDRCNQLWIVLGAAKALSTIVLILLGQGVLALVIMEAIAHLAAGLLQVRWVRQELPTLTLSWRLADRTHARILLGFGGTVLAMNLCALIIEQTDRLVIGVFLPVQYVTHYAAAWKLYMVAFSLSTILLQAFAPVAAHLHGRGDQTRLRDLFLRMTKYSVALALPLGAALGLSAGVLLRAWMGPSFSDARILVQVLLIAFAVTAFNHAGYSALLGMRRVGRLLPIYYVPQAALNLGLSLLLVRPLGPLGVALGTMVAALALEYPYLRYVLREIDITWRAFVAAVVRPAVWPLPIAFGPLLAGYLLAGPEWPPLVPLAAFCACAYGLLFWFGALDAVERHELSGLVRARLWRTAPVRS